MDEKDEELIEILRKDGRMSFKELGDRLGISGVAAKNRFSKLKEKGIIARVTVCINPEKIGRSLLVTIGVKADPKLIDEIYDHIKDYEELDSIWRTTGAHDFHIHGIFKNHKQMNRVLDEALGLEGVREYHLSIMSKELKHKRVYSTKENTQK